MTSDRFDNVYLNKEFVALNKRRMEMGKETVLPLKRKERRKYVEVFQLSNLCSSLNMFNLTVYVVSLNRSRKISSHSIRSISYHLNHPSEHYDSN